jgi:hypothetical protein
MAAPCMAPPHGGRCPRRPPAGPRRPPPTPGPRRRTRSISPTIAWRSSRRALAYSKLAPCFFSSSPTRPPIQPVLPKIRNTWRQGAGGGRAAGGRRRRAVGGRARGGCRAAERGAARGARERAPRPPPGRAVRRAAPPAVLPGASTARSSSSGRPARPVGAHARRPLALATPAPARGAPAPLGRRFRCVPWLLRLLGRSRGAGVRREDRGSGARGRGRATRGGCLSGGSWERLESRALKGGYRLPCGAALKGSAGPGAPPAHPPAVPPALPARGAAPASRHRGAHRCSRRRQPGAPAGRVAGRGGAAGAGSRRRRGSPPGSGPPPRAQGGSGSAFSHCCCCSSAPRRRPAPHCWRPAGRGAVGTGVPGAASFAALLSGRGGGGGPLPRLGCRGGRGLPPPGLGAVPLPPPRASRAPARRRRARRAPRQANPAAPRRTAHSAGRHPQPRPNPAHLDNLPRPPAARLTLHGGGLARGPRNPCPDRSRSRPSAMIARLQDALSSALASSGGSGSGGGAATAAGAGGAAAAAPAAAALARAPSPTTAAEATAAATAGGGGMRAVRFGCFGGPEVRGAGDGVRGP